MKKARPKAKRRAALAISMILLAFPSLRRGGFQDPALGQHRYGANRRYRQPHADGYHGDGERAYERRI
jgi:hypothetical protein